MMLMDTNKLKDETFEEYCHRISSDYKLLNNFTWQDIADIINNEYGLTYSETYYRKKEKRYNDLEILKSIEQENVSDQYAKMLALSKERVKLSDERVQINALVREAARIDTIKEIIEEAVSKLEPLEFSSCNYNYPNEKEGLLLLSDWHYGKEIDNEFNFFNPEKAKRRVIQLVNEVKLKVDKLQLNTITVANLGDMIAGNIHLPIRLNSRIDVITQLIEVSELLANFLNNLSGCVKVKYISVLDNHSRMTANKKESLEKENLFRIIDWYLQCRCPQIEYLGDDDSKDIAETNILGYKIGFIHGHKDGQKGVIDRINNFSGSKYDLICSAHYHHFSSNEAYDTVLVSNGSLMGVDEYAYDLRLRSKPSQTLIEISSKNVVESINKINLY